MSQNNSMSFESNNEFMPNNQSNQNPSFDQFMKVCFSNPTFFESMKNFYVSQQSQRGPTNSNQSEFSNFNNQNLEQSNFQQSKQREQESRFQYKEKEQEPVRLPQRKPSNPLSKFLPDDLPPQQKPNEPYSKPSQPPKGLSFDQKPIKSSYTEGLIPNNSSTLNLKTMKQNKSLEISKAPSKVNNFDDIPIKGVNENQLENYYKEEKDEKNPSQSTYDMDERPLTGCANKNFKQLIKQKIPNAILADENDDQHENEHHEQKRQHRNFLKRGSRQHLSSALNRSKQPKDSNLSANKSELDDGNRSITPRKNALDGRSTSQNRVLGKKTKNPVSEKVIPKVSISKQQDSFNEGFNSRSKPPLSKTIKVEPKTAKEADCMLNTSDLESKKKKKGKNVFNDDSQQSSSEQEVPYFKAENKPKPNLSQQSLNKPQKKSNHEDFDDNRTEVIEGVFLTQDQLDQILDRYGKVKEVVKEVVKETESEKLAALRKKYNEMIALVQEQKQQYFLSFEKEKQDFQKYKAEQMNKIKNQRRVMERQVKSSSGGGNAFQKEKEQFDRLKQELEKERQQLKKKDKNNRIMLQKYKKQNQQLKSKLDRFEIDRETQSIASKRSTNKLKSQEQDKISVTKSNSGVPKFKKGVQEEIKPEQVSYNDLKKKKDLDTKSTKTKFDYIEQDIRVKNKSISVSNQVKKSQNQWAFNKFDSQSSDDVDSESEKEEEENQGSQRRDEWNPSIKLSDLTKMDLSIQMVTDSMINTLFKHESNSEYVKYLQSLKSPSRTVVNSTRNGRNDYTAKLYSDRSKQLIYDNGTRKVNFQNGYSIVYFRNGDIKQTLPDKTVLYYFKEKEVDQITLSNGINIYRFENNQVEIHFQNGYIEIRHPDGTIKILGGQQVRR